MIALPLRPRHRQESGIAAAGRLAHRGTPYGTSLSFATTTHLWPLPDPPSRKSRSATSRTGTARSIPGRALASSVSGSPYQGPGTGLPPPISTSVPGTPEKPFALRAQAFPSTAAAYLNPDRSGNINTNNNRREVEPLQTSTAEPLQTAAPDRREGGRSRPATSACAEGAARTRSRATARATPTRTARRATPGRSSGAGRTSGCSSRCARGASSMAGSRRRMTGRAYMRGGTVGALARLAVEAMAGGGRRHGHLRTVGGRPRGGVGAGRGGAGSSDLTPPPSQIGPGARRYLRSGRSCHQDSDSTSTPPTGDCDPARQRRDVFGAGPVRARMRARRQDARQLRGEACGERVRPMAARSCPAPAVFAQSGDPTGAGTDRR